MHFTRLQNRLLNIILVPGLPHGNFVLSGEKQHFLVAVELLRIAHILSVHPNTGGLFGAVVGHKTHFGEDAVLRLQQGRHAN